MKMIWKTRRMGGLAAACAGLALAAGPAAAEELNYSVGFGPNSLFAQSADAYAEYMNEISGGELTIRVFPLSLVSLAEMGPGIRDGLTDLGFMAGPYYPAEFAIRIILPRTACGSFCPSLRDGKVPPMPGR